MDQRVDITGIYITLLRYITCAVPANIVLAAFLAPYLKRHIAYAALCIRHPGACGKQAGCGVGGNVHLVDHRPNCIKAGYKSLFFCLRDIARLIIGVCLNYIITFLVLVVRHVHFARPNAVFFDCRIFFCIVLTAIGTPNLKLY